MSRNVRTYEHFCVVARSLEQLGDRWTLLVVRDLLSGRKRFTDLMDRLGGITPKTLSQRLRELEELGIVAADREAGRREVWYHLTPTGDELGAVVDALGIWGLRHAWRSPHPGEPLHPEHLLRAVTQAIDFGADDRTRALWRFTLDGEDYVVESDGGQWTYGRKTPSSPPDVTVIAGTGAFARFALTGSRDAIVVEGEPAAVERFERLIGTIAGVVAAAGT